MIHIEGMKKMYKIACKKELNSAVTYMEIEAPFVAKKAKAGQFIIFRVDDKSERVPLTIAGYDREKGTVAIIFQKVGLSTELLGSLNEGDYIQDFVGPLGKPTDVEGKKRGRPGLHLLPMLVTHTADGGFTEEMRRIYGEL